MGDVLQFRPRKPAAVEGKLLCQNNHHKWEIWQQKPFDVKSGKLVTVYRCVRCGKQKVRSD